MKFNFEEMKLLEQSAIWNMPSFLNAYTLHDSSLLEFRIKPSDSLIVFINWDLHWNKNISPEFDLLVIRFAKVYWMKWLEGAWQQPTLDGAESKIISESEREQMLDDSRFDLQAYQNQNNDAPMMDENLTHTVLSSMNWGKCEILHGQEVSFGCFDELGKVGQIKFENTFDAEKI